MKIVNAEAHIISNSGVTPCQFVEKIGRTCYKSEDKITEDSATKFVHSLGKSKHFAMLEHFWVYFVEDNVEVNNSNLRSICTIFRHKTGKDLYSYVHEFYCGDKCYTACTIRVFLEIADFIVDADIPVVNTIAYVYPDFFAGTFHKSFDDRFEVFNNCEEFLDTLKGDNTFELSDEEYEVIAKESKTHTVHFICDRGVSHELVRHRPCSFAQESTRYCNYSNDKFGEEITVVEPLFFKKFMEDKPNTLTPQYLYWERSCEYSETNYFALLKEGAKPQEARSVLPNSLKTEIIVTANEVEWQHIINLRYLGTTGSPHPQMKEVMSLVVADLEFESGGRLKA